MMLLSALAATLVLWTSVVRATELVSVNLVVYLQDKKGALDFDDFDRFVKTVRDRSPRSSRAVFLRQTQSTVERLAAIESVIEPSDRITAIFLVSHGNSNRKASLVEDLALFTSAGPTGLFRELIALNPNRWHSDLLIYMNSCSAVCSPQFFMKRRFRALYEFLAPLGVRRLALWGATGNVSTPYLTGEYVNERPREISRDRFSQILVIVPVLLVSPLLGAALAAADFGNLLFTTTAMTAVRLWTWSPLPPGDEGVLFGVSNGQIRASPMSGNDPRLDESPCAHLFEQLPSPIKP